MFVVNHSMTFSSAAISVILDRSDQPLTDNLLCHPKEKRSAIHCIMTSQSFSSRFGRSYGLPGSAIMGQFGNTVSPGQFVRHGSDERSSGSHRRQNRSRERTIGGRTQSQPTLELRTGPAGVQERQEWMEALADVKERVTTLERNDRTKAGKIFRLESAYTEVAERS